MERIIPEYSVHRVHGGPESTETPVDIAGDVAAVPKDPSDLDILNVSVICFYIYARTLHGTLT